MTTEETQQPSKSLVLDDATIVVIRDLLQLCLLTQSNFVDFVRAIRLNVVDGKVVPTDEYITGYNTMISDYAKKAEEEMKLRDAQETSSELH